MIILEVVIEATHHIPLYGIIGLAVAIERKRKFLGGIYAL